MRSILLLGLLSTQVFAFFEGGLGLGRAWFKTEETPTSTFSGQTQVADFHIDPIPFIPIGFGVAYEMTKIEDLGAGITSADMTEVFGEIKAWLPFVPIVTPYIKARSGLSGVLKLTYDASLADAAAIALAETDFDVHSTAFVVGLGYKLVPFVNLFLETSKGSMKVKGFSAVEFAYDEVTLGIAAGL